MSAMKTTLSESNCRLDTDKEKISKLKDVAIETKMKHREKKT